MISIQGGMRNVRMEGRKCRTFMRHTNFSRFTDDFWYILRLLNRGRYQFFKLIDFT